MAKEDDSTLAERLIELVGPMIRVDRDSARAWVNGEADGVVFLWSANAIEQIEAFLQDELGASFTADDDDVL